MSQKTYTVVMAMCNQKDRAEAPVREAEIIIPESIERHAIADIVHKFMREAGHPVFVTGILDYHGARPANHLFTIEPDTP